MRISIFENNEFVAIETSKAKGVFQETVLDVDYRYKLNNKKEILKSDGTIENIQYFGKIE